MASIRNLKKDINYVLGDIIETTYLAEMVKTENNNQMSEVIVDEAIETFDNLIAKVNAKGVENKKAHFRQINQELESKARDLISKINGL